MRRSASRSFPDRCVSPKFFEGRLATEDGRRGIETTDFAVAVQCDGDRRTHRGADSIRAARARTGLARSSNEQDENGSSVEGVSRGMSNLRWIVAAGALFVAGMAFYVLMSAGSGAELGKSDPIRPALDDIDAESRAEMRDLLRNAE